MTKRWTITADKFLTEDQVRALLDHLTRERDLAIARGGSSQPIRDYYLIRTLLETGLRVFEVVALTEGDLQGQRLTVRRGKGGKARTVLLTKATMLMLREWTAVKAKLEHPAGSGAVLFPSRFGRGYTTRGVQRRVKETFQTIGLPAQLSVHSLRHTYASLLLASGRVGLVTVKENLGHSSIAITNLYSHAIASLPEDLDLIPAPSSQNIQLSELRRARPQEKPKKIVKAFLAG